MRRKGVSLLEIMIASVALLAVLGPLLYVWHVGQQTTSAAHSAAMFSALTAMEYIRHDLDQNAHPDGPLAENDPALPLMGGPGPDDGRVLGFWIPKPRPVGTAVKPMQDLVPVTYSLARIPQTDTFHLVRRESDRERAIGGVVLRRLWFNRLRRGFGVGPDAQGLGGFEDVVLPHDMIRVSLIAAAKPATADQMDRNDARQVQTYAVSFVQSVTEPSLVNRLRMPTDENRYQFLKRSGGLTLPQ
jgi:type II secretory pathway component PulJ